MIISIATVLNNSQDQLNTMNMEIYEVHKRPEIPLKS